MGLLDDFFGGGGGFEDPRTPDDPGSGDGDGYDGGNQGGGNDTTVEFSDIAPGWLKNGTLKELAENPAGFVLGAVLSSFLGGVEIIVSSLIDAIILLVLGSDGVPSATGTLGVADIPVFAAATLGGAGGFVATQVANGIRTFNRAAVEVATLAGPLSPIVYAALLAAAVVVAAWALRTAIAVLADAIPGVQGLI